MKAGDRVFTEYRDRGVLYRRYGTVVELLACGLVIVTFDCSLWKQTPVLAHWVKLADTEPEREGVQ